MRVPRVSERPTSANVAALAGVSRTTVSFVLNGRHDVSIPLATRRRVVDATRALGYRPSLPARRLAGGRSQVLGVMLAWSGGDTEEL
jgi:DNA-binding LacI/PurR family transcriptional regulator